MDALELADVLWRSTLAVAALPLLLMRVRERSTGGVPVFLATGACIALLLVLYGLRPISVGVRWGLTLLGFAAPLAMSVIVTRYLVSER